MDPINNPNGEQTMPRRALIVIDVQNEYFTGNLPIEYPPVEQSLPNIVQAMQVARENGVPVVVVQHDTPPGAPVFAVGSEGWKLHPEVAALGSDHFVSKKLASSFTGTGLAQWLADKQIDTLSVVGYMTQNCNASTIYEAAHLGFAVEHLTDATGTPSYENAAGHATAEEIHRVFNVVFHSNFAAVTTTREWANAVREGRALAKDNVYLSNLRTRAKADRAAA
jgi:nicotinamidase-related amidase